MKKPFILGLTGSIGMGKSTTAKMFHDAGVPVWDADATVHRMYQSGGAAIGPLHSAFPDVIVDGGVDRGRLRDVVRSEPANLARIEAIVHPLTQADRTSFIAAHSGDDMIVLDIPLLYEIGAQRLCDAVLVVSVPADVQRERVLARGTMTQAQLDIIISRQIPDSEKRDRADYVIQTLDLEDTRDAVQQLIAKIRSRHA